MNFKYFILSLLLFSIGWSGKAQNYLVDSTLLLETTIIGSDTLPNCNILEVKVFPKMEFTSNRARKRYGKLVRNVKKAYPFAIIARKELGLMNDSLMHIEGDRKRKKFIKSYEKTMFRKYEARLRKLTISQGKILIKLVYREFGNTSYTLVQEYRGNFSAIFWQGIARLFGSNLKKAYDPYGEDAEIEMIVQMIEAGVI